MFKFVSKIEIILVEHTRLPSVNKDVEEIDVELDSCFRRRNVLSFSRLLSTSLLLNKVVQYKSHNSKQIIHDCTAEVKRRAHSGI